MTTYMHRDIQPIAKQAIDQDWTVTPTAKGHWMWRDPTGKAVCTSSGTVGDVKSIQALKSDLRRGGLQLNDNHVKSAPGDDRPKYRRRVEPIESDLASQGQRRRDARYQLVGHLHKTGAFRQTKADEFPEDERNQRAADGLHDLANEIRDWPDDDPILDRIANLTDVSGTSVGETLAYDQGQAGLASRYMWTDYSPVGRDFVLAVLADAEAYWYGQLEEDQQDAADAGPWEALTDWEPGEQVHDSQPEQLPTPRQPTPSPQPPQRQTPKVLDDWEWENPRRGAKPKYDYDLLLNGKCYLLVPGVDIEDAKRARNSLSMATRKRGMTYKSKITKDGHLVFQAFKVE